MVKAQIYTVSLLDFINSISQTDDIQDVSARTVSGRVDLLAPRRGGVVRPLRPPDCGPELNYLVVSHLKNRAISYNIQLVTKIQFPRFHVLQYDVVGDRLAPFLMLSDELLQDRNQFLLQFTCQHLAAGIRRAY